MHSSGETRRPQRCDALMVSGQLGVAAVKLDGVAGIRIGAAAELGIGVIF
jgi:hypothetical protein